MYVVFYFQPLPAMLKNPFELNRECLPVRDHNNDDKKNYHRLVKNLTSHIHIVLRPTKGVETAPLAVDPTSSSFIMFASSSDNQRTMTAGRKKYIVR
jgi:hypothetical protein